MTTASRGSSASSVGRCLRMRPTGSVERSTKRTMSSPSGDSVTIRCLSSPRAARHVVGRDARARVMNAASTGNAARCPRGADAARLQVDAVAVGVEDADRRRIDGAADDHLRLVAVARLGARDRRQPGRHIERGQQVFGVPLLVGELARVRLPMSEHDLQRPASKYAQSTRQGYGSKR